MQDDSPRCSRDNRSRCPRNIKNAVSIVQQRVIAFRIGVVGIDNTFRELPIGEGCNVPIVIQLERSRTMPGSCLLHGINKDDAGMGTKGEIWEICANSRVARRCNSYPRKG